MYTYNLGKKYTDICVGRENKTAIIFSDGTAVSFAELNKLSNRIYYCLEEKGIRRRDVVAIQNNKSKIGFATMIACLKAGIIYTNFDYTNPVERIRKIFSTAEPALVLADQENPEIRNLCKEQGLEYEVYYEADFDDYSSGIAEWQLKKITGDNPAYIMFTSGSTGIPKGVVISQRSLLNFIQWGKEIYHLTENDIMTNVNPIYFDNSVFDFYCSVFNGITMVAFSKDVVDRPKDMLQLVHDMKCTFWFSVPSMLIYLTNLKLLTKEILENIRIFSFGGEGYPKELLRKLYYIYKDTADFYNVYGPTEGTCICSAYKIEKEDFEAEGLAPLGQIASNFDYVILNEREERCYCGELCLIGDQLALGYYNDEERTKKSFVQYNGIKEYYVRMYKTGDLVEIRDGKLYFVGRVDNQIKHMGYRIELEEIENALVKLSDVKQCAVIHSISKNNFSKLIAFIASDIQMEDSILRQELRRYLPDYMIPNKFVYMDELPKNANGKIDRKKLESI